MPGMMTKTRNILLGLIIAAVVGAGALALDLANKGLIWQFAWEVTGEEEPIAQMRGVVEYAITLTRPQPNTQPMVPIAHTNVNPYGVNTFLQNEVERAKIDEQLRMIDEAGFGWIRQQFEWAEIEVDGRGQFTDTRNDMDGDGEIDTISAWDKYDYIVDQAEAFGLQIQARLDNPPDWSRERTVDEIGAFAPPDDFDDFVNFSVAVAERYKGRITVYQVWNEPNIFPEWGNQAVDPEAYTDLLCRTYDALKAVDPNIIVLTGAMAATIELNNLNIAGGTNLQDFVFLQRMYDAGAADCFDILSVQAYGLFSGPTDRRLRPTTVNIARNQYMRDMMVANGDAHKPIWISEAAWNAVPTEEEFPGPIDARYNFGQVTLAQQAEYAPIFYQRAQEEWPWIGVINYWFFTRPDDRERDQSFFYFRMVEPDYSPEKPTFTPLPIYESLRDYITTQEPALYQGVNEVDGHWAITTGGFASSTEAQDATFGTVLQSALLTFEVYGTDASIRWRGEGELTITVDGEPINAHTVELANGWRRTVFVDALTPDQFSVSISAASVADFDIITVGYRPFEKLFPALAPFIILGIVSALIVISAVWSSRPGTKGSLSTR